jgi:hypothetical protein
MKPTIQDVHVNRPLTNISIAFMQSTDKFVADRAFPVIQVDKQSDSYFTYDRGDWNRDSMEKRAPATESAGDGYTLSTDQYFCDVYALHKDVPDEVRANQDMPLDMDSDATRFLAQKALIRRENSFAAKYFTTGVWTNDWAGVAGTPSGSQVKQWNDDAATPIEDIRLAKRVVLESTGQEPNKLILGKAVWDTLLDHPAIVDRVKGGSTSDRPAVVLRQAVAALLEVEEILVMSAIQNTAKEGATAAHSFIGGKKALLVHAPQSPGLLTPSAGYTFAWRGYMGGTSPVAVKKMRMDLRNADRVEINSAFDQKKTSADLGFFINSVIA